MKGIVLRAPGGLDRLEMVEMPDPCSPAPGEIRVRLHGSSLNYHDYLVVTGRIRTADGRIPMSDGAGVVEAVGDGVTEFAAATPSSPASSRMAGRSARNRRCS